MSNPKLDIYKVPRTAAK